MKKIALFGSAPSSVQIGPFDDPSWEIWACSPGARPFLRRVNVFFEIHRWEPAPWFPPEYVSFMAALPLVYMLGHIPEIPNSTAYPKTQVLDYVYGRVLDPDGVSRPAKFNPNDFGSSLSWMMALAIMQRPDEIGLWGVDMSAGEEYGPQRDGLLSLIHVAKSVGIKITVPPESDLLRPCPLYGFREIDPMFIKLSKRIEELSSQQNHWEATYQDADRKRWYFKGALDDVLHVRQTWVSDPQAIERMYANPEPRPVMIEEPPVPEMTQTVNIAAAPIENLVISHTKSKRRKSNGVLNGVSPDPEHPESA